MAQSLQLFVVDVLLERKVELSIFDMVRSIISLWGYALETVVRVLNVLPTKSIASTPYEIWKGKKPDFSYFRVGVCPTHVKKHDTYKLESRTTFCRFVGYPKETSR